MNLDISTREMVRLHLALEFEVRRCHALWNGDAAFDYWLTKRDEAFSLYRKVAGQDSLQFILREREPAQVAA